MLKKILIPVVVFVGVSAMAFYKVKSAEAIPAFPEVEKEFAPVVVLELFTSQGCSSCPPADILLEQAKKQYPNQVYALSYHVDYWNYIGWEDPFSNPGFSRKQKEYNRKFSYPSNYTPQMVINGKEHFVGSNTKKLFTRIKTYKAQNAENQLELTGLVQEGNTVSFRYLLKGDLQGKSLRTTLVLDQRTTLVRRGENRNRKLTNSNIVIAEKYIPVATSEGRGTIRIPAGIGKNEKLHLIVVVENDDLDITAAAKLSV